MSTTVATLWGHLSVFANKATVSLAMDFNAMVKLLKCSCIIHGVTIICYSDIDECLSGDGGGCEQSCINLPGSYECSCQQGYVLGSNGINCNGESSMLLARSWKVDDYV